MPAGARNRRRDLLEHRQPLPGDGCLIVLEAGEVAARPRQTGDEARTDRVGDAYEHNRDRSGRLLQRTGDVRSICEDQLGLQGE